MPKRKSPLIVIDVEPPVPGDGTDQAREALDQDALRSEDIDRLRLWLEADGIGETRH